MKLAIAAALALLAAPSLHAQATQTPAAAAPDYSTATPMTGNWTYSPATGGSEAVFVDSSAQPQLVIHCTRATRRVTISKPASASAPYLFVWTSSGSRNVPATFNAATARLSADFAPFDPLLDALAFSRGRLAIGVSGTPALVLPAWAEPARVAEDCRV